MIQTLPEELTSQILHYISDRRTLHSLTLVSATLNRLSTPHLYTHLTLHPHSLPYLRPLAALLWRSPKHSACVRSISVRRAYGGNLVPWPQDEGLDALIKTQIEQFVKEGDKEDWYERVREGADALPIASLLLRSLPGVRVMQFDGFMLVDPGVRREWGRGCEKLR
ncbi:hypothetical protein NX059_011363 [Plenodomus lindquistii]|nr:hypothetical protein NX059_011363 [Plenodomus lindquistii]